MNGGGEVLFWLLFLGLIIAVTALVEFVEHRRTRLPNPHHTATRSSQREEWDVSDGRLREP